MTIFNKGKTNATRIVNFQAKRSNTWAVIQLTAHSLTHSLYESLLPRLPAVHDSRGLQPGVALPPARQRCGGAQLLLQHFSLHLFAKLAVSVHRQQPPEGNVDLAELAESVAAVRLGVIQAEVVDHPAKRLQQQQSTNSLTGCSDARTDDVWIDEWMIIEKLLNIIIIIIILIITIISRSHCSSILTLRRRQTNSGPTTAEKPDVQSGA